MGMVAALLLLSGCGESRRPVDALDYIRVGADPSVEAEAVERGLAEHGYELVEREEGDGFVALGFAATDPDAEAVRIVTNRGLVMALDTPREEAPHLRGVRLLPGAGDLDGDGRPELAIGVFDRAHQRSCISIVRVRSDGLAVELPIERPPGAEDACIEGLHHVGGDRQVEAILVVRFTNLAREETPTVQLAYRAVRGGGLVRVPVTVYAAHEREVEGRVLSEIAEIRREMVQGTLAPEAAAEIIYCSAVELAARARYRGEEMSEQLRLFDAALAGLVLTPSQSSSVDEARRFIAAGWTRSEAGH